MKLIRTLLLPVLFAMVILPAQAQSERQKQNRQDATVEQETAFKAAIQARQDAENFRPVSGNPDLNELQLNLLRLKAEFAEGQYESRLSSSQIEKYRDQIALMEQKLRLISEEESSQELQKTSSTGTDELSPEAREALTHYKSESTDPQVAELWKTVLYLQLDMESGKMSAKEKEICQEKIAALRAEIQKAEDLNLN